MHLRDSKPGLDVEINHVHTRIRILDREISGELRMTSPCGRQWGWGVGQAIVIL